MPKSRNVTSLNYNNISLWDSLSIRTEMKIPSYVHIITFLTFTSDPTIVIGQDLQFRLLYGETPFEGIVEVYSDGDWEPVCDNELDFDDICNDLGLPGVMMVDDLDESSLSSASLCDGGYTLGIRCNYPGYIGCYERIRGSVVMYTHNGGNTADMSVEKCVRKCGDKRFVSLFKGKCRCGDNHPSFYTNYTKVEDDNCDLLCGARHDQICGKAGDNRFHTVYSTLLGACGGTFHEPTGWILSPGFPGNYNTGVNCLWTVILEDHYVINVTLRMLDLWDGDVITFTDIEGRSANGIFIVSNSALPDEGAVPFRIGVTLHNNLTVRFVSGPTSKALGFAIFYEAIAISETRTRRTSTTGITSEPPATARIETTRSGTTKIQTTPLTVSQPSVSFNDFTENATRILTKLTNPRTNPSPVHRLLKTPGERTTPPLSLATEQVPTEKASIHSNAQERRDPVKSVRTGIIVGGVLGATAFIVVIVILVWMFMWYGRRFNSRRTKRQAQHDSRPSFQLGKLSYGNALDTSRTNLQKSSNHSFDIAEYDDPSDIKIADENSPTSCGYSKPCEGATVLTEEQNRHGDESEGYIYEHVTCEMSDDAEHGRKPDQAGFVDNIAYESAVIQDRISVNDIRNMLSEVCVDESGVAFVENVAYESIDTLENIPTHEAI